MFLPVRSAARSYFRIARMRADIVVGTRFIAGLALLTSLFIKNIKIEKAEHGQGTDAKKDIEKGMEMV